MDGHARNSTSKSSGAATAARASSQLLVQRRHHRHQQQRWHSQRRLTWSLCTTNESLSVSIAMRKLWPCGPTHLHLGAPLLYDMLRAAAGCGRLAAEKRGFEACGAGWSALVCDRGAGGGGVLGLQCETVNSLAFRIRTKIRFESGPEYGPHPSSRLNPVSCLECDMKARKESGGSVRIAQLIV